MSEKTKITNKTNKEFQVYCENCGNYNEKDEKCDQCNAPYHFTQKAIHYTIKPNNQQIQIKKIQEDYNKNICSNCIYCKKDYCEKHEFNIKRSNEIGYGSWTNGRLYSEMEISLLCQPRCDDLKLNNRGDGKI